MNIYARGGPRLKWGEHRKEWNFPDSSARVRRNIVHVITGKIHIDHRDDTGLALGDYPVEKRYLRTAVNGACKLEGLSHDLD